MTLLTERTIPTPYGEKSIAVTAQEISELREPLDVMTVSAFYRDYYPARSTLIGALDRMGVSVLSLSREPEIDLRGICGTWLSRPVRDGRLPIGRIGCIELSPNRRDGLEPQAHESQILSSIQAYFHMLHIASLSGIEVGTVGLPVLGAGPQRIDPAMTSVPTINECFRFLKGNEAVRRICIIGKNISHLEQFAQALENSYSALQETKRLDEKAAPDPKKRVFISYSSKDANIADNLCAKLEASGVRVWYAPRNIHAQDYAGAIVEAITRCTDFVVIISQNSLRSHHVLNEIDLAFNELNRGLRLIPLRIDEEEMGPSFRYYLSSQHWMDAHLPPLEKRLEEFVASIAGRRGPAPREGAPL